MCLDNHQWLFSFKNDLHTLIMDDKSNEWFNNLAW